MINKPTFTLASPAMRGSTPLDVAASSVMDNNGLALALEEPDLDKVKCRYLNLGYLTMNKQQCEVPWLGIKIKDNVMLIRYYTCRWLPI